MTSRGPAAPERLRAGRAVKWGWLSRALGDGGRGFRWVVPPLFPTSHMQIFAPASAGGVPMSLGEEVRKRCRLYSFVIHVFAFGDPRNLIPPPPPILLELRGLCQLYLLELFELLGSSLRVRYFLTQCAQD